MRTGFRILFVCMGNICRSPTAEGAFRKLLVDEGEADSIHVDSAGTHDYHVGEPPDPRSIAAARRRGIDLTPLRARQLAVDDFERFDLLLAMDARNVRDALALAAGRSDLPTDRLRLFLEFAPATRVREVPDPYYGGPAGFEQVLDLVEAASRGLLEEIRARRRR